MLPKVIKTFFNSFFRFSSTIQIPDYTLDVSNILVISVFLSFYTFIIIYFFGRYLGDLGSSFTAIFGTFTSLLGLTVYIIKELYLYFYCFTHSNQFIPPFVRFTFADWFSPFEFQIKWGLIFDPLVLVMMWVVLFITLIVQIYCLDYMFGDPFFARFYSYLSLFSFFMLFLVSSPNYLQVFLGWEGVGLASFMLISFWSTRQDAVFAGMKAMFINRIGDVFFIFSMLILLKEFKTLDFVIIKEIISDLGLIYSSSAELKYFSIFIVLASMAKSAQLGLHTWLPDAMEGPTPVSALIHAATMVTAGIFILIRSSFILINVPVALSIMSIIGGLTAFFGASVACVQFDIKKVIAYSTCSQLGYMMLACGSGNFLGSLFHLVNHAFFKALLFLGAGSVIHSTSNEQDMRKMGSLVNFLPFTCSIMTFGSAALAGVPFFSGFYSKDNILEYAYIGNSISSTIGFWFGAAAIFCTAFYSFRLIYMVFFSPYSGGRSTIKKIHEAPKYMTFGLVVLVIPSVFFGFVSTNFFSGPNSALIWSSCISQFHSGDFIALPNTVRQLPLALTLTGFCLGYLIYVRNLPVFHLIFHNSLVKFVYKFLSRKWYFDDLVSFIVKVLMSFLYRVFWIYFEKGFLYYFGPGGLVNIFKAFTKYFIKYFETSFLYLKFIIFSLISLFFLFLIYFGFPEINIFEYSIFIFVIQVICLIYYIFK